MRWSVLPTPLAPWISIIEIICRICNDRREELGKMELEETKVGRLDHKILKLTNMKFVLGVDALHTEARSNTTGLCIIEHAPWGHRPHR